MKAAIFERVGGPDVFKIASLPKPIAKEGEVVVHVKATSLNLIDWYLRMRKIQMFPYPIFLGVTSRVR